MGTVAGDTGQEARANRPRGRPQRLPVDPVPIAVGIDPTPRTAWLLATTRLLSPATQGLPRTDFIEHMREQGVVLDSSRVSRWESGTTPVDARVLEAYETVAELPEGVLTAADGLLRRTAGADATRHPKATAATSARLDASFERIENQTADGADWLRVVRDLQSHERMYLHPATWTALCDQLVGELSRSSGLASLRRHEAAASLMALPAGRRHLSMSVGRFVMHPDAQNVAPALALLREVGDDSAAELVLRLMGSDSDVLRRGATEIAGSLASFDMFPDGSEAALEGHALREMHVYSERGALHGNGLDLVTHLSEPSFARVVAAVPDQRVQAQMIRTRSSGEVVPRDQARSSSESIAAYAEAALSRMAHEPDQMLRRLVREAMFHVRRDRRHLAAVMIAASPYAAAVAQSVLAQVGGDGLTTSMGWALLRRLGHVLRRDQVAGVVLRETRPALRSRAMVSLGLSHGDLPDQAARLLLAEVTTGDDPELGHAALLALGLSGHASLGSVKSDSRATVARAAGWWQTLGPAIHDLPEIEAG